MKSSKSKSEFSGVSKGKKCKTKMQQECDEKTNLMFWQYDSLLKSEKYIQVLFNNCSWRYLSDKNIILEWCATCMYMYKLCNCSKREADI